MFFIQTDCLLYALNQHWKSNRNSQTWQIRQMLFLRKQYVSALLNGFVKLLLKKKRVRAVQKSQKSLNGLHMFCMDTVRSVYIQPKKSWFTDEEAVLQQRSFYGKKDKQKQNNISVDNRMVRCGTSKIDCGLPGFYVSPPSGCWLHAYRWTLNGVCLRP